MRVSKCNDTWNLAGIQFLIPCGERKAHLAAKKRTVVIGVLPAASQQNRPSEDPVRGGIYGVG
jgi:hypothetical protein